ncbi:hypothetical protein PHYC_03446 [Phycisphaerales bacterium]|nr:hypothetical protein PHYC_03446 [Phycisphaerales bacterium]
MGPQGPTGPTGAGHILKYKAADESHGTTLADDADLQITMDADGVYEFEAFVLFTTGSNNNSDFEVTIDGGTGGGAPAYVYWTSSHQVNGSTTVTNVAPILTGGTITDIDVNSGISGVVRMRGVIRNASSTQTLKVRFRSGHSAGTSALRGSFLKAGKF